MTLQEFAVDYVDEVLIGACRLLTKPKSNVQLETALRLIKSARTVYLIGNGGSATLASHMATDLRLAGIHAFALTDVAEITTIANDVDFDSCFSNQVKQLVEPGDLVIGISGSGNSVNIIKGLYEAVRVGAYTLAIVGKDGGHLSSGIPTPNVLHIPTTGMGPAQDLQQIALHILCYYLMEERKAKVN